MHYIGVVFPGEDITGATHVCGKLIDLGRRPRDKIPGPQVAHHKIVPIKYLDSSLDWRLVIDRDPANHLENR
jgi:hypothetical protein